MSTKYVIRDTIKDVGHRVAKTWVRGVGPEAEFNEESIGWWATLAGSQISVYLGPDEPELKRRDDVRITIEKD